jgi:hypothetical protein
MSLQSNLMKPGLALAVLCTLATACGADDDDAISGDSGASGNGGTSGASAKGGTGGTKTGAGTGGSNGAKGGAGGKGGSGGSGTGGKGGSSASGGSSDGATAGTAGDGGGVGGAGNAGGEAGENDAARVNLGSAEGFAILAKSAISTVPTSVITGDVGVSPAAATYITGFSLTADSTNTFATSPQVTGSVFAADYTSPTPSDMTTAVSDMELAFTDAAGRAPDVTELGAGDIGGMTLEPGVYQWGTGLLIPTDITLEGSAKGVWIFQVAQDLTVSGATSVILDGGALAKNVFWQVSGLVELGTTAHFEGIVLSQTSITLGTGSSINGRLLAQTAVSLDASTVVEPAP